MCNLLKKYKILLLVEIILFLVLLPGCFKQAEQVHSINGIVGSAAQGSSFQSVYFPVEPGVYQVRAKLDGLKDGYVYVNGGCERGGFRGFRCNGVTMFPGQTDLDFEIYVLEKNEFAYVTLDFGNREPAQIQSLEVLRTNLGAGMAVFVLILACCVLNGLVIFREGIVAGRIRKEQQMVFWGLSLSVFLAFFPYLTDYFSNGADIMFHWLRIEGLKETLMQGDQFPVRVQSYWLYDHGYAVSSFYSDVFLMIPAILRLIGFSLMNAYKMFVFVVMTATAWIAYYSFKRCTGHTYAALFGSVIYVLAPYRIYNFYNRGAVGEYLAMVFLPLVISGMYRLYTEDTDKKEYSKAKWPLIIGLTGILQSHLLTCEMTAVFMAFICVIFLKRTFRKQTFMQLLQAAALCLLLNVWFWLPLLHMMRNDTYLLSNIISHDIQYMGTLFAEFFQLYQNVGAYQEGMYHAEPFQMGISSLLMLLFVTGTLIRRFFGRKESQYRNPYDKKVLFCSVMIWSSWFMSTKYFPWDAIARIPLLGFLANSLQFPTRLFSPVSAFCAVAAAFFYLWLEEECRGPEYGALYPKLWNCGLRKELVGHIKTGIISLLIILAVGSATYHVNDIVMKYSPIWLYNAENMGTISVVNGEYLLEGTGPDQYYYHNPVAEEGLVWSDYEKNGTTILLQVKNTTQGQLALELPLTGYKGYAVECVASGTRLAEEVPYITEERGSHGDLRILVPGNFQGTIRVAYRGFAIYRIAETVSALTLLGIGIWILFGNRLFRDGFCKRAVPGNNKNLKNGKCS